MSGGVSPQFLKFKGLLAFFDEMGKDMACTLDDIQEQAPHYFNAIKEHISQAEEEYRQDNAYAIDTKIGAVKKLYFTAVKYIEKKRKKKG
jgi:hypothetical protein